MKSMFFLFALFCLGSVQQQVHASDLTALELGQKLRVAADDGDADSMLLLAILLMKHAPNAKRPHTVCDGKLVNPLIKQDLSGKDCVKVHDRKNKALMEEWSSVGTKSQVAGWITKSAEGGNKKAIGIKCDMGADPLAPATLREDAQRWCARL